MAILKFKKLIEDLENSTTQVLTAVASVTKATSAGYAGTSYKATSAGNAGTGGYATTAAGAGTASFATTASYSGTARVAHFGSSGTGALSGTAASV